jgi:hypothetical protein
MRLPLRPPLTGILAALALTLGATGARAQAAPCYAQYGGQLMFMFNGALDACARTIGAARSGPVGVGTWGGQPVHVDSQANVWVNGQYVGVARNLSGTVGSLSDRCAAGDTRACEQWRRQSEEAARQMERLYPEGWAR